jgi:uncharacterized protein DUF5317
VRLILFTLIVSTTIGLLSGRGLRDFPSVRPRWWWLAFLGVALQLVPLTGALGTAAVLGSFVALIVFATANLRAPGFVPILLGLLLNALVISANQGMPVTRHALAASNQAETLTDLVRNGGTKHHLADEGTALLPLGDVIPIGSPVDQAISIGDVLIHLGGAWFMVAAMPRRQRRIAETKPVT